MAENTRIVGQLGKIECFDETLEPWDTYIERVEQYFKANEVQDEKKAPAILSLMGAKTYSLVKSLFAPDAPGDKTYTQICDKLNTHLNPKPREIAERFRFMNRDQKQGESIADFNAAIRKLAATCNFDNLNKQLRDRLVCGLKSESVQHKLLAMDNLNYDTAIATATAMEHASRDAAEMHSKPVNKMSAPRPPNKARHSERRACFRCLRTNHPPNECYFKDKPCDTCGQIGHIPRACRNQGSRGQTSRHDPSKSGPGPASQKFQNGARPKTGRFKQRNFKVHQVENNSDSDCFNLSVNSVSSNANAMWIFPKINGHKFKFELDTGSAVSIMPMDMFGEKFKKSQLKPTRLTLKTYTGEDIIPLGKINVTVKLNGQRRKLDLYVIEGGSNALFGRSWLREIQVNWAEIHAIVATQNIEKSGTKTNKRLDSILNRHNDVFQDGIGKLKGFKATFNVEPNTVPRFLKARNVPYSLRPAVEAELRNLEEQDIIERVDFSHWATPIVPVAKPDGKVRLCADFKTTLNPVLKGDQYPLPKIDDIFASLAGGQKFTKIDLRQAYLHYEVDEEHRDYLTINTEKGLFRYKRLLYGVKDAPSKWQRAIEQVLQGIPHVQVILDDMLITGPTEEKHLDNLEAVLQRLEDHGLRANLKKCAFFQDKIDFCGHTIDKNGLHEHVDKIKAITNIKKPENVTELQAFLGLVNYYRKFLPNIACVLRPLYKLTEKVQKFVWSEQCQKSFEKAKQLVASNVVLTHYDPDLPVVVQTDACEAGISGVMSHIMPNGDEKPILFLSRSLTKSERNYSQLDREALAIYSTVRKLHHFLYLKKFELVTDCKALTSIFSPDKKIPEMSAQRLQRYAIFLSGMNYTIKFRKSSENQNCDALSRLPLQCTNPDKFDSTTLSFLNHIETATPIDVKKVKIETQKDKLLCKIYEHVLTGNWPKYTQHSEPYKFFTKKHELSIEQGCLMWGNRVVIPPKFQGRVLKILHDAHVGIVRMKLLARRYVYWPSIDHDI